MRTRLALFDIDHTLVDVLTYHEAAYPATMSAIFGVSKDLRDIEFSGKTTPRIFRELATAAGFSSREVDARLSEALDLFDQIVLAGLDSDLRSHVLPGIPQLLECLRGRGIVLGVVTGNPPEIGKEVLQRSGLRPCFVACAFGTEASERWQLVQLAVERTSRATASSIHPRDVVVVGDSAHDIAAGKRYGATTLALGTGLTPRSELAAADPDFLFPNASDHEAVCRVIAGDLMSPNGTRPR